MPNQKTTKSVRLLVDSEPVPIVSKSALPLQGISEFSQKVVELGQDTFQKSLNMAFSTMIETLSTAPSENDRFAISEVRFSLVFDASGEVSIASLAKGHVGGKTGIEVLVKRKP